MTSQKNPHLIEFFLSLLNYLSEYQENGRLPYIGWLNFDPLSSKTALLISQLMSLLLEPNIYFKDLPENMKRMREMQEIVNFYLDLQPEDSSKMRGLENSQIYYHSCTEILSNFCIGIINQISDQNYLKKIAKNFIKLLRGNSLEAKNTFLMYSMKEISFMEEILIITWRINQNNQFFINLLLENENGFDLFSCLLTILHDKFLASFQSGTFNLAITFLTQLSLIREFATRLISPLKQSFLFPSLPVIAGNYIDFAIAVIYSGIMSCLEKKVFCPSINFIAILLNLSPYAQNLTKTTCYKIVQLLMNFANYEHILENQNNGVCLGKFLKIIDNILVYQGEVYFLTRY